VRGQGISGLCKDDTGEEPEGKRFSPIKDFADTCFCEQ
jgi:hypothetical protein